MTLQRALQLVLVLALVVALGERAAHARTEAEAQETREPEWPERTVRVVREVEVGPWTLERVGFFGLGGREVDTSAAALVAAEAGIDPEQVDLEHAGAVIVRMPEGELSASARAAGKPAAAYEVLTLAPLEEGRFDIERTTFVRYEPRGGAAARDAMIVLLPGMFGTPEPVIDALVGQLRDRGWHVLRMLTHPSRFTQRAVYRLSGEADVPAVAGEIAELFGDRAAECALAVESVCATIAEQAPAVPVGRRIGLGLSGGGMALPTVIAREPQAYAAAVLVGAGCDYAAIALESNYTDWIDAVRIEWSEGAGEDQRAAFTDAYRAAASLDSYSTAPAMRGLPMLMIHGSADKAVPAGLGDLLWERLGRPERWTVPAGHEVLFLAYLPSRAADLLDWLERLEPGD